MKQQIKYTKTGQPYIIDKKTGRSKFIKKTKAMKKNKCGKNKTVVKIKTTKKYGKYLAKHIQKEHPKTKGKVKIKSNAPEPDWTANTSLLGFVKKGKQLGVVYKDKNGNIWKHYFKGDPKLRRTKDGKLAFVNPKVLTIGGISG